MEHLREFKEKVGIVEEGEAEESPEVHRSAFSDPSPQTRDVSIAGGGKIRQTWGAISSSLGAMRPLVAKLDKLLLDPPEGCSSKKVKDRMHLLKEDVKEISSCLDKLSELEDPPLTTKCWMNEARDLSYKIEDYIDSLLFVKPVDPSLVVNNIKTTKSLLKWFSHVKTPKEHEQIAATVSEFRKYAQEVIQRRKVYVLSDSMIEGSLSHRVVSVSHVLPMPYGETAMVVIDSRMNEFINSLVNDGDEQLKVVSVLGSACLGKTTLARLLYGRIGKRYHCRAFIRVSKKPDMKRIFHDMLSQFQQQDPPEYHNEVDLIDNIKKYLRDKRYLIIVDDVWTASAWDIINDALPKGSHGSRIITTTQIEDVALKCCCYQSERVFKMKPLDYHHSRKLFFTRLFGSESVCPNELKEVSNKIVEICDGLPLATISMASLLASQPVMSIDLFTYIHKSLSSCFLANPTSERTRQALNLSFNNLPHYLKTCLMYLIMYPEGYTFLKNDLVKQWVAEGFIHARKRQDMEEVAESYLYELIGRRFIQPIRINYNNEVLSCAVHGMVHDLIAQKSVQENFIVAIDYKCQKNVALYHKARRLSLLFHDARYAKTPANIIKSQVRSLTFFGLSESMPTTTEFKLLRVLNLQLSGYGGSKRLCRDNNTVDLSVISELSRLRYLKIASHLFIKLPDYMGGLHCLETLDIIDAVVIKFGIGVCLPHLLHLYLSLHDERNVENWIDKLKHLQDLRLTFPSAGSSSQQEENMLVLHDFISGHDNLKTIVVACDSSDKVIDGTSDATISWDDMAPPPLLERFEFSPHRSCIFPRIPPWVEKHNNLSVFKIAVKELQMICIGILRGLPALTALSLYVETMPVDMLRFDKPGFSVLKYIKLRFMSGVPLLKFEADAMPNLLKLKLVFNATPQINQYEHGIINIDHMPGLREICVKFVGAATGPEYALVSNHPNNPIINRQSLVYCSFADDKESKSPVDERILRSPESSSRPHVPDVWFNGRGEGKVREMRAPLGAMRPLVAKMDKLLLDPPQGRCYSESVKVGLHLLKEDVKEFSFCLDELLEVEDPPPTAKCWMNEACDLSYRMEDYIDNLLFVQPAGSSLCPNYNKSITHANPPRNLRWHEQIAATISEFRKYAQEAIQRCEVSVPPDSGQSSSLRHRFVSLGPMLPMPYEDIVIDGQMNELIDSLANDEDQQLKVVSVFGSACLGKTTLATVLYNKLDKRYHCRAFIRVSRKPDMKRIFRDMLSQLQRQHPPQHYQEIDLIHNIKKYLHYKRYLIIIDDIWDASVWDNINHAFPKGSHGSTIVTTTQIEDVALACCCYQSEYVFEMKPMDAGHSRKLFFNRLFASESDCPEQFKKVLDDIVEICGGLPLTTINIASLLASQPVMTEDLLKHIHQSLSSCFSASSTSERTRNALNLSFNNLPYYLKTCLMYLSMYPEGYTFCNDDLVKQWMAEGFIDTIEGQDREKVAESYLHQLIVRGFIQPIHINYNNEVLWCAVHDAVHALITHQSSEKNFTVAVDYSQRNVSLPHKVRRLSLICGDARYAKTIENITESQVRSLMFLGVSKCMPCITEFKLLRVLNLQLTDHVCENNPVDLSGISELLLLRYLKIGSGIYIEMPSDGLQCLETLDITDAIVIRSPWGIILPHLLHLSLPFELSLLRWIGIQGGAGRLKNLEDLHLANSLTDDSNPERNIEALGSLIAGHGNLRTVVVADGSTVKNVVARGAGKVITSKPSKEEITSGVPLLQRFEFSPASGMAFYRIPKWFKELDNLCILKITVKMLEMDCVGILRGLRALAALSLYVRRETSERIIFDKAGFSALNYFKLRFMTGIAWIKFEKDAMPNLLKLKLVFTAIPSMDRHPHLVWTHAGRCEQYKRGNALIIIEHMPGLREVSAKYGGAASDLEYIKSKRIGISNDPGNPEINMQWVDGQSTRQKHQTDEILEEDPADETVDIAAAGRSPESLHEFTLDELLSATSNFSSTHFSGSHRVERKRNNAFCYPDFYEGSFQGYGNLRTGLAPQHVVVRCLSNNSEWLLMDKAELEHLARVRHPRLVRLLGFCDYYHHRMLVYEDMPKKTLEQRLLSRYSKFTWLDRVMIAVQAATGLAFLHEADKPMVHGDIKASNILLDSYYMKLPKNHQEHVTWDTYCAREAADEIQEISRLKSPTVKLFGFGLAKENARDKTSESDVYDLGVVLLELLNGCGSELQPGPGRDLVEWSRPYLLSEDKLHELMDPRLYGEYSLRAAWSMAMTACRCLESEPEDRPRMRDVVDALEPLLSDHRNDGRNPSLPTESSGLTFLTFERQSRETKVSQYTTTVRSIAKLGRWLAGGAAKGRGGKANKRAKEEEEVEEPTVEAGAELPVGQRWVPAPVLR